MTPNRKPELTKEESEGFERFVREAYIHDLSQAKQVVKEFLDREYAVALRPGNLGPTIRSVFEKLATPRVFLIDQWRKLSSEEHMIYSYPDPVERMKAKAEAMRISKQVGEMIQT